MLDAVAAHGLLTYLNRKTARKPSADPVADLRAGWDLHVGFGLAHPAPYSLMYGEPRPGASAPAAAGAADVLALHIHRIAEAGRLRLGEEPAAAAPGPVAVAVALRAVLPQTTALTVSECGLLSEWLDRITDPACENRPAQNIDSTPRPHSR